MGKVQKAALREAYKDVYRGLEENARRVDSAALCLKGRLGGAGVAARRPCRRFSEASQGAKRKDSFAKT